MSEGIRLRNSLDQKRMQEIIEASDRLEHNSFRRQLAQIQLLEVSKTRERGRKREEEAAKVTTMKKKATEEEAAAATRALEEEEARKKTEEAAAAAATRALEEEEARKETEEEAAAAATTALELRSVEVMRRKRTEEEKSDSYEISGESDSNLEDADNRDSFDFGEQDLDLSSKQWFQEDGDGSNAGVTKMAGCFTRTSLQNDLGTAPNFFLFVFSSACDGSL